MAYTDLLLVVRMDNNFFFLIGFFLTEKGFKRNWVTWKNCSLAIGKAFLPLNKKLEAIENTPSATS